MTADTSPFFPSIVEMRICEPLLTQGIGNRPYNKFDNNITLDMFDPELGLKKLPKEVVHHVPEGENLSILSLKQFMKISNE